jgi:hypothetical protein
MGTSRFLIPNRPDRTASHSGFRVALSYRTLSTAPTCSPFAAKTVSLSNCSASVCVPANSISHLLIDPFRRLFGYPAGDRRNLPGVSPDELG